MIYFFLIDGVGIGGRDPGLNPLARERYLLSHFVDGTGTRLPRGGTVGAADATLGVPGRPQSATGHTTLLTGVNASKTLGKHLLGFPNERLRQLLYRQNLFLDLRAAGRSGTYANAYRCGYLDGLELEHDHPALPEPPIPVPASKLRPSATTASMSTTGQLFRTFDDLRAGTALYHDITNELPRSVGSDVPRRQPREAAGILLELRGERLRDRLRVPAAGSERGHDLAMFEFFRTDEAGHAQDFDEAARALGELDELLHHLIEGLGPEDGLLVTSDHGNLEDLSSRQHTLAKVPVLGFGTAAAVAPRIRSILDVHPSLLRLAR